MNASDAAELHERTKHSWQRIRARVTRLGLGQPPLPVQNLPRPRSAAVAAQGAGQQHAAIQALSGHAPALAAILNLAGLARLLFFSAGVTRILHGSYSAQHPRAPCTRPSSTPLRASC